MSGFRGRICTLALLAVFGMPFGVCGSGAAPLTKNAELSAADIAVRAQALADPRFGGRIPATDAGEASAHWIAGELARIGVTPANAGSYFQNVPVMAVTLDPIRSHLTLRSPGGTLTPQFGTEAVYWSPHYARDSLRLASMPVVFVGTGSETAYGGADVRGKAVLLLAEAGNGDADLCASAGGAFATAAKHGAAAVLAVASGPAGACLARMTGTRLWLRREDKNGAMPRLEGWLRQETAQALMQGAGYGSLLRTAETPAFRAVPLTGVCMDAALISDVRSTLTRNVVGFVPGGRSPGEFVILSAPWDGYAAAGPLPRLTARAPGPQDADAKSAEEAAAAPASDNRMGVAMLLDLAERYAHETVRPSRSLVFLFPTLSHQGLQGAQYFASHPLWPLRHVVADYHLSAPVGAAAMNLADFGRQDLQDGLIAALKVQGRKLSPAPACRSGHMPFAEFGIPAVAIDSCGRGGKPPRIPELLQDERALYAAARALADTDDWPNWAADSPHRALRERLRTGSYPAHPATVPALAAADVAARAKALADDRFAGRAPDSEPGEALAQWIADELKRIGVAPGARGHYLQAVTTVNIAIDPQISHLRFDSAAGEVPAVYGADAVFWSPHYSRPEVSVTHAPVVFAGYGISAPGAGRDDYAGMAVRGRTVVVLAGAPAGFADAAYYARPAYKFAEAAGRGAAAVLIVSAEKTGWPGGADRERRVWLLSPQRGGTRAAVEGWLRPGIAETLFRHAGLDFAQTSAAAGRAGFRAMILAGTTLSAELHSALRYRTSYNVVGMLRGTRRPGEVLLFAAPWDGAGTVPEVTGEDKIFNGAAGRGVGAAMALELAETLASGPRPERTMVFLFPTWSAEGADTESTGMNAFVRKPLWPLKHFVGAIGFGGMLPGAARDLGLDAGGRNGLSDALSAALRGQGRTQSVASSRWHGANGDDMFAFAAAGVPTLELHAGTDLTKGGRAAGEAALADYFARRFRRPGDDFDPAWDFSGTVRDLQALTVVARQLAAGSDWPQWRDGRFAAEQKALTRMP